MTDHHGVGLSWFSCQAEGKQFPIKDAFTPYPIPIQQDLRRAYYASVSFTDHNIGQLLGTLTSLGLDKNTVVLFHGDHGYQLGERNIYCKETNFNLAAHVPLMVRAPMFPGSAGKRVSAMVEIVDVYPTLVELAGLPPLDPTIKGEPALGGQSLKPLLAAAAAGPRPGANAGLGGSDEPAGAGDFVWSFSQYARSRCPNDLFDAKNCQTLDGGKANATLYNGYSVRNTTFRYTRWTLVMQSGEPLWDDVINEEFYDERPGDNGDTYDMSERTNLAYTAAAKPDIATFAAVLKTKIVG